MVGCKEDLPAAFEHQQRIHPHVEPTPRDSWMGRRFGAPPRATMLGCKEDSPAAFEHQRRIHPHVEPRRVTVGCDEGLARRRARQ